MIEWLFDDNVISVVSVLGGIIAFGIGFLVATRKDKSKTLGEPTSDSDNVTKNYVDKQL